MSEEEKKEESEWQEMTQGAKCRKTELRKGVGGRPHECVSSLFLGGLCWQISLYGPAPKGLDGELSLDGTRCMI